MQAAMGREAAGDEDIAESGEVVSPASPAGAPSHGTIIEMPAPTIHQRPHTWAARADWAALQRPAPASALSNGATCSSMSDSGQRTPILDQADAAPSAQVHFSYNLLPARKLHSVKASLQHTPSGMSMTAISHIRCCLQAAEPAEVNSTGGAVPAALKGFTKEGTQAAASVATTVDERCGQAPASYTESAKQECAAALFNSTKCVYSSSTPSTGSPLQSLDGLKQEVLILSGCKHACTIVHEICTTLRMCWCLQASVHRVRAADIPVEWEAAFAVPAAGD